MTNVRSSVIRRISASSVFRRASVSAPLSDSADSLLTIDNSLVALNDSPAVDQILQSWNTSSGTVTLRSVKIQGGTGSTVSPIALR